MLVFSSQGKIAVGPHYDHNRLRAEAATAPIERKRAFAPKCGLTMLARGLTALLRRRRTGAARPRNARNLVRVSRRA